MIVFWGTLKEDTGAQAQGRELVLNSKAASFHGVVVEHDGDRHGEQLSGYWKLGGSVTVDFCSSWRRVVVEESR